ncbi:MULTISPECIES: SHOCT domain-containing protein [unclassified Falsihalocynthiibacter]|uniref:SHOCT domain-containing protein n=1 Tax=unclassified Falsihalocynthiibacter TaxID=2854191 RepID=UPI0035109CBD
MADGFGFFDIFFSIFWIFLMVAWIWVMVGIVSDVFRSEDLNGLSKALWILFIIVVPWLGVLSYLIVRGDKMQVRNQAAMSDMEKAQREYVRGLASVSAADEIEKLAALKESGAITEAEFLTQKSKVLAA